MAPHVSSTHVYLRLADIMEIGPVYTRDVTCCQRVWIKQLKTTYAETHELLNNCRPGTTTADDGDAQITENLLDGAAKGPDVPVKLLRRRRCVE